MKLLAIAAGFGYLVILAICAIVLLFGKEEAPVAAGAQVPHQ